MALHCCLIEETLLDDPIIYAAFTNKGIWLGVCSHDEHSISIRVIRCEDIA